MNPLCAYMTPFIIAALEFLECGVFEQTTIYFSNYTYSVEVYLLMYLECHNILVCYVEKIDYKMVGLICI